MTRRGAVADAAVSAAERAMLSALEAAELPADAIEVARVSDAWGVRGWFKILPYSASPEALFSSKRWFLLPSEKGAPAFAGCRLLKVREAKEHSGAIVVTAQEIADRNAAEALRGARIFVARSSFPSTAKDEFYWVDLIGLRVQNREQQDLGTVRELLSTGPQTVLVIDFEQPDGKRAERMIPFVAAYIDDVDLPGRCIHVDWQTDY